MQHGSRVRPPGTFALPALLVLLQLLCVGGDGRAATVLFAPPQQVATPRRTAPVARHFGYHSEPTTGGAVLPLNCSSQCKGLPLGEGYPPMCEPACRAAGSHEPSCLDCRNTTCTSSVASDTRPPPTKRLGIAPTPMSRVMLVAPGWEHTRAYHTLLLPRRHGVATSGGGVGGERTWPVLVELPGNYCGPGGPVDLDGCGSEWTMQGWGAGAYTGQYIWLTLPFLTADLGNATAVQLYYWGCGDVQGQNCSEPGR